MIRATLNDRQVLEVPHMQDLKLALSRDLDVSEEFRQKHNAWASKFGWEGGSMRVIYDETNLTIYVPEGGITRLQEVIEQHNDERFKGGASFEVKAPVRVPLQTKPWGSICL